MSFRKIFQMINRLYSVRRGVDVRKNVHIGLGKILWASEKLTISENVLRWSHKIAHCLRCIPPLNGGIHR